jgi:hypothetical protein
MNRVLGTGRLTKDPSELYKHQSGKVSTEFTLAIRDGKDKQGNDLVTFAPMKAWGRLAENICEIYKKGYLVEYEGRLSVYQDRMKVTVDNIWILSSPKGEEFMSQETEEIDEDNFFDDDKDPFDFD